jgi:hypothetical protein
MSDYGFLFLGPNPRVYVPKGKPLFEAINPSIERIIGDDKVTYRLSAMIRCNAVAVEDIRVVRFTDEECEGNEPS